MSMKTHICKTYKVEFADKVLSSYNDRIVELGYNSDDAYVSEDETQIEIPRYEIENAMRETDDIEFRNYLQYALDNADAEHDFVRFEIY